jgi:branched-chain amino acid transport system ATP-binding protein
MTASRMAASHTTGPRSAPTLHVANLTVRYGGVMAVHDVSLDVAAGAIAGLIGPNGAGKTTFIDCLSGFTPAASGRIELDGESIDDLAAHERARRGMVRTFQSLELFDDLTVRENLLVPATPPRRGSFLADLLGTRAGEPEIVGEVVGRLRLGDVIDRRPDELSNGQRHMVALARALVARPRVLLLDEPAAGLDTRETAALAEVLRALPDSGVTVLLVDHDMSVVLGVCDTVHVLDFGGLIASGPPMRIRHDPMVISAYLGTQGPS